MDTAEASRKHRILFIDDTPSQREMTGLLLENAGFEVHTAATGPEGLRRVRELRPDLVLLDVVMPDTSGYDVCQELKMAPDTMDVVVLLLSGLGGRTKERVAGLEWGADGYLAKPVDPNELVATIHALLRIRYAEAEARASATKANEAGARLAAMMEASAVAIISTDAEGKILEWNAAAERLFGYTSAEMRGTPVSRIVPGDRGTEWQRVWTRVRRGEHVRGSETVRLDKGGVALPVFLNVCPVRDQQGNVTGMTEAVWENALFGEPSRGPHEQADSKAVSRHAFERAPLDPEVAPRVEERADHIIEDIRRVHGIIDDETFQELLRDDDNP
jgi:PAS domain S-box-containing protein